MVMIKVPNLAISDQDLNELLDKPEQKNLELDAKAFIFDKDGTLLTHDHFVPIMEKRVELLTKHFNLSNDDQNALTRILGFDPDNREIIPRGTMFIAREDTRILIDAFLFEHGIRSRNLKGKIKQIFQDSDEQVELEKFIRTFPDVPEFLERLKSSGAKIAIATHDTTAAAINQLALADIDKYMDLIVGLDYSDNILHKPSPTMLQAVCAEFELEPKDLVVVGDSVNDVLMGIHGGAGLAIGVLTGEHKAKDFKQYSALISKLSMIEIIV
jgi:HAD superfamily hydrolase (TIGR01549 family)